MIFKRMATTMHPGESVSEVEPGVEQDIRYIEWLMTWYCRKPSMVIANIIVSRLESLHEREQQGDLVDPVWVCRRLLRNWEYIARNGCRRVPS